MYGTVIFDFDGVVIHSREVQKCAFGACFRTVYGEDSIVPMREFFMQGGDSLQNIFKRFGISEELMELYYKISREKIHEIQVFGGMDQLLGELNKKGVKCGLCTGKDRKRTLEILEYCGLRNYFQAIVCSDDVEHPKPSGESLLLALKQLNADHTNAVMVGDGVNDILCAKEAGVESIGVSWGDQGRECLLEAGADMIADTVDMLQTYLLKEILLMDDLVIQEKMCNMKCSYCLTNTSSLAGQTGGRSSYQEGSALKEDLNGIFSRLEQYQNTCILKISGGEVLLIKNIEEFIREQAKRYQVIQILTNGTLLDNELLTGLKRLKNVCIQLSLDHHTLEGNTYRTQDRKQLEKILQNLDQVAELDIPVEINCVLTDKNTALIEDFAAYLLKYKGKRLMLLPFPVRGKQQAEFFPSREQWAGVQRLLEHYEIYKEILPPKAYLMHLLDFIETGIRKNKCYIPQTAQGIFDDGRVTPCPNYWFTDSDNILKSAGGINDDRKMWKMRKLLISSQNRLEECRKCFTPWELFNLYVSDVLTLEELSGVPLYSFPHIEKALTELKNHIRRGGR